MTVDDLAPDVPGFKDRTAGGHRDELIAGHLLRERGLWVTLGPNRDRRDGERKSEWHSETDLYVALRHGGPTLAVEVKGRPTFRFGWDPATFPFPTAIMYRAGKGSAPVGVVHVAGVTGAAVGGFVRPGLAVEVIPDRERGYSTPCFMLPRAELVTLDSFAAGLRQRLLKLEGA